MATNNIRSSYIKQVMEDAQDVGKAMEEAARQTFRSLLDESLSNKVRQIITEGEDEYSVDEIDAPKPEVGNEDDEPKAEDAEGSTETPEGDEGEPGDGSVEASADDDGEGSEFWNEFDTLQGEDGSYDCTGMDKDTLIKVFRQLNPDDGVVVCKKDDNTVELSDEETDKTYIIDLGAETEGDKGVSESSGNTGYTDNYQSQTAMTTPPNKEVADKSTTYSMDGGVPEGDAKPFAGTGDNAPFDKKVNEEDDFSLDLSDETVSETMTTQEHGAYNRGTGMVHTNNNDKAAKGRNSHAEGEQVHTTMQNSYSESQLRKLKQIQEMANKTFEENKQLRKELGRLVGQLQECVLINHNMGNIVRVIMEHSTTSAEKHEIARRFGEARTKEQSNALYKTINEELKRRPAPQIAPQVVVAESKSEIVSEARQPMYQSTEMKDFIARMENVYRKK